MRATLGVTTAALLLAALASPARAESIVGNGRTLLADCGGQDAAVSGSNNRVVFHGPCRALRVTGSSNQVEVDLMPGSPVEVLGTGNHVLYTPAGAAPVVSSQGAGNLVEAGSSGPASAALAPSLPDRAPPPPATVVIPPAGAPAGAIVLEGDGQDTEVNCTGRDVVIHGSESHYRLNGGCRSVTVQGRGDSIQAELLPGARVAIGGSGVRLDYTLTREGPAPVVSVTGSGSQATHIQRYGGTAVVVPPGGTAVIGAPAR